jgi:hypothetical protein
MIYGPDDKRIQSPVIPSNDHHRVTSQQRRLCVNLDC